MLSLAAHWPVGTIRSLSIFLFWLIFCQTWPQNPSRTTGLVLQCRLHQKSAPQTNSKSISWPSGPLAFSDSRILALGLGPKTFKIRLRRAGFLPPGPGESFVFLLRGRRLQPRVGGPGGGPVLAPSGCSHFGSNFKAKWLKTSDAAAAMEARRAKALHSRRVGRQTLRSAHAADLHSRMAAPAAMVAGRRTPLRPLLAGS